MIKLFLNRASFPLYLPFFSLIKKNFFLFLYLITSETFRLKIAYTTRMILYDVNLMFDSFMKTVVIDKYLLFNNIDIKEPNF